MVSKEMLSAQLDSWKRLIAENKSSGLIRVKWTSKSGSIIMSEGKLADGNVDAISFHDGGHAARIVIYGADVKDVRCPSMLVVEVEFESATVRLELPT